MASQCCLLFCCMQAVLQAGADVGDRPPEDTSPLTRFIARHPLFYSLSSIKAALCNPQMQQLKEGAGDGRLGEGGMVMCAHIHTCR